MHTWLPNPVRASLAGGNEAVLVRLSEEAIDRGTGAATGALSRVKATIRTPGGKVMARTLVRKALRPLTAGRHAALADNPRHWADWRREAAAYRSGLLPLGPGLRAPLCYGVVDDEIYLEFVEGPAVPVGPAAEYLARRQVPYESSLDRPWLAMDQLGQRLKVSELDWTTLDADPRVVQLWQRRWHLYEVLIRLPYVRSHGDYSVGNLVCVGSANVVTWGPIITRTDAEFRR